MYTSHYDSAGDLKAVRSRIDYWDFGFQNLGGKIEAGE